MRLDIKQLQRYEEMRLSPKLIYKNVSKKEMKSSFFDNWLLLFV